MNQAQQLHQEAMELAEQATISRFQEDFAEADRLIRAAFEKERDAALSIAGQLDLEPSRSVLLRSAATLALECHELREAERLASRALVGEPPTEIALELREILQRVFREWRLPRRPTRSQVRQAAEIREDAEPYKSGAEEGRRGDDSLD